MIKIGKKIHYGKPSSYPYFFVASRGKKDKHDRFISGTFKTKKACRAAAQTYAPRADPRYHIRIIDRRK